MKKNTPSKISNPQSLRVLMIEDSEDDAQLLIRDLKKGGYNPLYERVETAAAMKKALQEKQWDIILCDYNMPQFNAPSAIAVLKEANIDIPLLIVSGAIGEETAVECMLSGAQDFIMKGNLSRLCPAIARELKEAEVKFQREAALKSLRESEERYKALFDRSLELVYIANFESHFIDANDAALNRLGYTREDIPSLNFASLLSEDQLPLAIKAIQDVQETGQMGMIEFRLRHKNGSDVYVETRGSAIISNGIPVAMQAIARDITERKKMDKSLKESEERYRMIVENMQDSIGLLDLNGKHIYQSPSEIRISGFTPEEIMNMSLQDQITPESFATVEKVITEELELEFSGKPVDSNRKRMMEVEAYTKNGGTIWQEVAGSFYRDEAGKPIGILLSSRDITGRKKIENELRQSEEKYRSIIENIQDGYVEVDLVGNWTFVNDVICRHMGYSRVELIGTDFHKLHTKRSAKRSVKAFAEVYKTGEPLKSLEIEGVRKDGTIGNYELSVSLMKDANGQPTGFRCISRDITERKRMEEEIRQSEERYRTILDEMENGYFEVDLAGNYTFINDTNCRQLGYSKEEMIGLNFRVPMVKESIDIVSNAFKNIYITGKPQRGISYKARRKDGTTGFAEISGFPLKNKKSEIIGFRGMALDITERKQAEEALSRSEEKYRSIIENMQEPYWENNLEGNLTFVNDALCKYLGYSREELIGKKIYRENKEAAKKSFEAYNRIYRTGEPIRGFEETYTRKDGIKGFAEISASLIRDAEGKPIGFRCFSHDITERKRMDEELQRTLDNLRKAFGTTIQVMVSAVEMRDPYTAGHQLRVADIARAIATEMGLSRDQVDGIRLAGSIHDIGKLSIPAEILAKPTKLTAIEFSLIKEHSRVGYEMLKDMESPWPLAEIVYQHHERMNGSGYPRNLKGDEIIVEARIMAVADVVEAMASHRPYRPGLGIEAALGEIEKNKGIFYDNVVADACLRLFREKNYKIP
jgi:PAS domain S-box-containing protein/putative nucleotidyltransferase with HDIG domain